MIFADYIVRARVFFAKADRVEALRVHKLLPVAASTTITASRERVINEVAARLKDPDWTASAAIVSSAQSPEITGLAETITAATMNGTKTIEAAMAAVGGLPKVVTERPKVTQSAAPSAMPSAAPARQTAPASTEAKPMTSAWGITQSTTPAAATAPKTEENVLPATSTAVETPRSFVPQDIDLDVVPRVQAVQESTDVTKLKLPDNIASIIENAADKLNKGLSDGDKTN
jgi:hypothetical protein